MRAVRGCPNTTMLLQQDADAKRGSSLSVWHHPAAGVDATEYCDDYLNSTDSYVGSSARDTGARFKGLSFEREAMPRPRHTFRAQMQPLPSPPHRLEAAITRVRLTRPPIN